MAGRRRKRPASETAVRFGSVRRARGGSFVSFAAARASILLVSFGFVTACSLPQRRAPFPPRPPVVPVSYARLLAAEAAPQNWFTYSGNYRSERFTRLDRITKENVAQLRPVWTYEAESPGRLSATPLVADGVMVLTEPPSTVVALDARTGRRYWRHDPAVAEGTRNIGFPRTNRGVAVLGDSVFFGTLDARVLALDARDGAVRWSVRLGDNRAGYSITAAPLAMDGKIIVGMSGGEAGARGFLDAYDAGTGERLWRFWTVPSPDEPGGETWEGDSWKTGGGATWLTGSYDPELGLLYWGTGNPAPEWNGDGRAGDNLHTCSLVAIEVETGALRWHFQFTPHDLHGWDANQIPVLVDADWEGAPRRLVALANRNGFLYVLDRETGEFLRATAFAKQTWAERIAENGRPVRVPGMEPTEEGALVWPGNDGATNWYSPAFDPDRGTLFVRVREEASRYFKGGEECRPGQSCLGGRLESLPREPTRTYGAVRAFDLVTGDRRWEYRQRVPTPFGILATATGLVFSGSDGGRVYALDADTGEVLWNRETEGGGGGGAPMSFAIDGEQFLTVAGGRFVTTYGLPGGTPGGEETGSGGAAPRPPAR